MDSSRSIVVTKFKNYQIITLYVSFPRRYVGRIYCLFDDVDSRFTGMTNHPTVTPALSRSPQIIVFQWIPFTQE
ncbi:MAG: hypothetical protein SNJ64_00045 [Endomicrobiia bacterium]